MSSASPRALLFTDVVDSTRLAEQLGEAQMTALWARHDRRARQLLAQHGGLEIDRTDGFFLLFDGLAGAAHFALAYHQALTALGLRARAGIHWAPVTLRHNPADDVARGAKPLEVDGLAKPLAARITALALGGQTLLSASARSALGEAGPAGTTLRGHGHYRLKGVEEPVEVFEIGLDGSPFTPPADTEKAYRVVRMNDLWCPLRAVRHNLPPERDSFVGRAAELRALAARLDAGVRLLTVLGAGGIGKTRLVRRYGLAWLGDWSGGVYFCDLSEARSLDGIHYAVALALGVQLSAGDPGVQLGHAIAARGRCLVVLDNFEQVATLAAVTLSPWLDRAAQAAFVVTSRERLHLGGEEILAVEPLALDSEAVELFAVRAGAQRSDFVLGEGNRSAVADVVRLLDGLPLAIELAAARVRVMSPAQIVERLGQRFRLLAGAPTARRATLEAAIDWSWALLKPWEQAALAQSSVFEGGFTLDAADAVLDLAAWPEAPPVMDVVQALVDKSLLRSWYASGRGDLGEPCFGMYLSIRDYAAAKLSADGSGEQMHRRHGRWFAGFGSDAALQQQSLWGGAEKRRALALQIDDLVAACRRAVARGDAEVAVPTYRAVWQVLFARGPASLGLQLGDLVLSLDQADPSLRAAAWLTRSMACRRAGRLAEAGSGLARALALATDTGDRLREQSIQTQLGLMARDRGAFAEAQQHLERAAAITPTLGIRRIEAANALNLGTLHALRGEVQAARQRYEAAQVITREVGDRSNEASVTLALGNLCNEECRVEEALAHYEAALVIVRELGNLADEGFVLSSMGDLFLKVGRLDEALAFHQRALQLIRDAGSRAHEGVVLGNLGSVHLAREQWRQAQQQFEASLAIHREVGNRRSEGIALRDLGRVHQHCGRLDEAQRCFEQALQAHRALGLRRLTGIAQGCQAELLLMLGDGTAALAALDEGEAALREVRDRYELARLLAVRCKAWRAGGDATRAQAALAEAEAVARAIGARPESELERALAPLRDG